MNGKLAAVGIVVVAFMARGISAPATAPKASASDRTEQPETPIDRPASTPFRALANTSFDAGVKQAIFARANFLFDRAQDEGNAIVWLNAHYKAVAGDIGYLRKTLGSPTGEADQFAQTVNRSAELAATALAIDWMKTSRPRLDRAAVNLSPILDEYRQTQGGQQR